MQTSRAKVAIIGAGAVGSTFAFSLMIRGVAGEIVLIDKDKEKATGECMDLNHGASFVPPAKIYSSGYEGCQGADIVVITAGAKQKPGETRINLIQRNTEIFKGIIPEIIKHTQNAILLVVSNPMDILTYVTLKISGFPSERVIGSGTVLDSSRFRYLIGKHCRLDPRSVHAYIIGEHGDSEFAVWSQANVGGMLLADYCPTCKRYKECGHEKELLKIFDEVKKAAYKIIELKGATYYAIGVALVRIVEAILRDENSILPVSTLIDDYCGINDVYLSIPSVVNRNGVDKFLKLKLSASEEKEFKSSAMIIKDIIKTIKL